MHEGWVAKRTATKDLIAELLSEVGGVTVSSVAMAFMAITCIVVVAISCMLQHEHQ